MDGDMDIEKSSLASTSTLGSIPPPTLPPRKPVPQQRATITKSDIVFVKNIHLTVIAGHTAWGGMLPQTVLVTARILRSVTRAASSDSIEKALNYQTIYDAVLDMTGESYQFKEDFVREAVKRIVNATGEMNGDLEVKFPRGMLRAEEGGLVIKASFRSKADNDVEMIIHTVELENVRITCIIGINPGERQFKQPIVVNLSITQEKHALREYTISNALEVFLQKLEQSECLTVERLVSRCVRYIFANCGSAREAEITISIIKPSVFGAAEGPGVQISRRIEDFPELCQKGYTTTEEDLRI